MAKTLPSYFPLLVAFISERKKSREPESSWFFSRDLDIYIRHYSDQYVHMLSRSWYGGAAIVLANIQVTEGKRRTGIFRELIATILDSDIDFKYLKIEQVSNPILESYLIRTGWICIPNLSGGCSSYYLER